jgi:hypothetical protein
MSKLIWTKIKTLGLTMTVANDCSRRTSKPRLGDAKAAKAPVSVWHSSVK